MNNKMAIIHIYKQLNLSNKLSKHEEQRQNHGYGEHFDGYQMGGKCGGMVKRGGNYEVQIGSYRIALGMESTV